MYSLRVLEAEVPSPGEGRAAVPPAPQGKALPASSRFRWPRCLNRAREDAFPREGRFSGPGGRVEDSPGADTHARGARPRGAERAGRPHAEHVLSPAPPGEAALPFHAPFTGGKAETSVSLGRGLQATRWPAQGWNPGGHETVAPSRARRNCPDGGRVPHSAGCRSEPPLPSHRDKPELCFRDILTTPERPERNMGTRRNQRWRPRVALRRARPATHRGRSLASLRRAGLFSPHASTPQPGGQTDAGQCWSSQVSRAGVSCALRAPGVGP